ncbi:MAG: xanthine dehydrogenase family protein subunit M, partial [Alphaproteobacteria bacterium]
ERVIPAAEFLEGVMTTALAPDELLCEARLPILDPDTKFGFQEFNRRAGDFAIAAVLATARLDGGLIRDARIGVGGAEDRARRITAAEQALDGKPPGDGVFRAAADAVADAVDPMEDINTSAGYRRDLVRTLTRRALEHAFA